MRTSIKLLRATPVRDKVIRLKFSDGSWGDYDLAPTIARGGPSAQALADPVFFHRFAIAGGALAWPNGFELGSDDLRRALAKHGLLQRPA